jgi:hypothetical protein
MLVDVVELVQSPEAVVFSPVWVQRFERLLNLLTHSTYLSLISGYLVFGGWDVLGDREGGFGCGLTPISDNKFRRQIVQRTIEVLDSVPRDDWDCWRHRIRGMHINYVLSRLGITLTGYPVRMSSLELLDDSVQLVDVLVGLWIFRSISSAIAAAYQRAGGPDLTTATKTGAPSSARFHRD